MKISVIIPVYNVAPYLRQCVNSVIAQTEHDWECICIDDGSTDGSGAILAEFAATDSRIRVITQKNAGVSAARNAGLAVAQGDWVMFLDGDDSWEKTLVSDLLERQKYYGDCDLICFRNVREDKDGRIICRHPKNCHETFTTGDCVLGEGNGRYSSFMWGCWDKMINRRFLHGTGVQFAVGMRLAEDSFFAQMLLAQADKVLLLPDVLGYRYRIRDDSAVHMRYANIPENPFCIFSGLLKIWRGTRKPGLLKRLQLIAAEAPTLGCGSDYNSGVRSLAIEYLLDDRVFNRQILPFMFWHGTRKSRLFAGVYKLLPRYMRRKVLLRLGRK